MPVRNAHRGAMPPFVVGSAYRRREIHDEYGGQRQGGIATPSHYPLVFLFTSSSGEQYGYKDGWEGDLYLYTGQGQVGDMTFDRGNRAIRDHVRDGKDLHMFEQIGSGMVQYIGQMVCLGHRLGRTPDSSGEDRRIIVFELLPVAGLETQEGHLQSQQVRELTLAELRRRALDDGVPEAPISQRLNTYRERSISIKAFALARADGRCEGCGRSAPFVTPSQQPYLEVHHIRKLSDGGPDHPRWVAALCPNCHREAHYGERAEELKEQLTLVIGDKEAAMRY